MVIGLSHAIVVKFDADTAKWLKGHLGEHETFTEFIGQAIKRECEERNQLRARGDLPEIPDENIGEVCMDVVGIGVVVGDDDADDEATE
jgi:hypothetical protein